MENFENTISMYTLSQLPRQSDSTQQTIDILTKEYGSLMVRRQIQFFLSPIFHEFDRSVASKEEFIARIEMQYNWLLDVDYVKEQDFFYDKHYLEVIKELSDSYYQKYIIESDFLGDILSLSHQLFLEITEKDIIEFEKELHEWQLDIWLKNEDHETMKKERRFDDKEFDNYSYDADTTSFSWEDQIESRSEPLQAVGDHWEKKLLDEINYYWEDSDSLVTHLTHCAVDLLKRFKGDRNAMKIRLLDPDRKLWIDDYLECFDLKDYATRNEWIEVLSVYLECIKTDIRMYAQSYHPDRHDFNKFEPLPRSQLPPWEKK